MNPAAKALCKEVYIAARAEAMRRGCTKEHFDELYLASGLTQEKLGRIISVCTLTAAELAGKLHVVFALINCVESPVIRDGMLNELAKEFLISRAMADAEWEHWAAQNGRSTVDQLADDAVKVLQSNVDAYFDSLPKPDTQ